MEMLPKHYQEHAGQSPCTRPTLSYWSGIWDNTKAIWENTYRHYTHTHTPVKCVTYTKQFIFTTASTGVSFTMSSTLSIITMFTKLISILPSENHISHIRGKKMATKFLLWVGCRGGPTPAGQLGRVKYIVT